MKPYDIHHTQGTRLLHFFCWPAMPMGFLVLFIIVLSILAFSVIILGNTAVPPLGL